MFETSSVKHFQEKFKCESAEDENVESNCEFHNCDSLASKFVCWMHFQELANPNETKDDKIKDDTINKTHFCQVEKCYCRGCVKVCLKHFEDVFKSEPKENQNYKLKCQIKHCDSIASNCICLNHYKELDQVTVEEDSDFSSRDYGILGI